jgi:hypothetical protein
VVEQIFEGGAKDMPTAEVNSTTSSARRVVVGCEDSEDAARRTIRLSELEANVFGMACAWPEHRRVDVTCGSMLSKKASA